MANRLVPKSKDEALRLILTFLAFVVSFYLLSKLTANGIYLFHSNPVPMRANPVCVGVSIACGLLALVIGGLLIYYDRPHSWIAILSLVVCSLLSFGFLAIGIAPGPGSIVGRDIEASAAQASGRNVFALSVFFPNGSPEITNLERARLSDAVQIFRHCELGDMVVRGFASAAPFRGLSPDESDRRNLVLANDRATAVSDLLHSSLGSTGRKEIWNTYYDMNLQKQIVDEEDGKRILSGERLNRRVEVTWDDSQCNGN